MHQSTLYDLKTTYYDSVIGGYIGYQLETAIRLLSERGRSYELKRYLRNNADHSVKSYMAAIPFIKYLPPYFYPLVITIIEEYGTKLTEESDGPRWQYPKNFIRYGSNSSVLSTIFFTSCMTLVRKYVYDKGLSFK
jgi:hypothetical protein